MNINWIEEEVKLKDLKEYDKNPRYINKEEFQRLVESLQQDGYHQRIVVDHDNTIIGGHMRKKAFKEAGFDNKDLIKVLKPERKLTDEEFRRINIRDNIGYGNWDFNILANEWDFSELLDIGFPENLLQPLEMEPDNENTESESEIDDDNESSKEKLDEIPEPKKVITQKGYMWQLGNHRLYCNDSLNEVNLKKLLDGNKADFCFIDPPYGIKIDEWDNPIDEKLCLSLVDKFTKENSFFAFTHQMPKMLDWLKSLEDTQYKYKDHIVWVKRAHNSPTPDILRTHETLMIYKKGKKDYIKTKGKYVDIKLPQFYDNLLNIDTLKEYINALQREIKTGETQVKKPSGNRNETYKFMDHGQDKKRAPEETNFTNVWSFLPTNKVNLDKNNRIDHPTIKPILLMNRIVELCANENEIVLEMFLGSGTTILACEDSNRVCYGMELSPYYCDIIINRWQNMTGKQAIHIETGKTYNELLNL